MFSVISFTTGEVLSASETAQIEIRFNSFGASPGAKHATLYFLTDQVAAFNCPGQTFTVDLMGTVLVPEPIPGDANGDNVVNEDDAAVLATYWQTASGAVWGMGDFNGDGRIDDIDATLMAANWQSGESNAAAPEPSMLAGLLGLCLTGLLASSRRKRKSK